MPFFLLTIISFVPMIFAATIIPLFGKSKLAFSLMCLLFLIGIWQLDVAILSDVGLFSSRTTLFLFKLFRFGTVFIIPTLFYVATTASTLVSPDSRPKWWKYAFNKFVLLGYYLWTLFVYVTNWTSHGVKSVELVHYTQYFTNLYFPIYGDLTNVFDFHVGFLMLLNIAVSYIVTIKIPDKSTKSFLQLFLTSSTLMYIVGICNMSREFFIFSSGVACLSFSTILFLAYARYYSTKIRLANQALQEQKEFLGTLLDIIPSVIYVRDASGRFILANNAFAKLYGKNVLDVVGHTEDEFNSDGITVLPMDHDTDLIRQNLSQSIPVYQIRYTSGAEVWLQITKTPVRLNGNRLILSTATDISDRIRSEERIRGMAYSDSVTNLPNRIFFMEHVKQLIQSFGSSDGQFAIVYLDLDRFKNINDTLGHTLGDEVLKATAQRLVNALEPGTMIARLGGDEFAIQLPYVGRIGIEETVQRLASEFEQPILIDGFMLYSHISLGVSVFPQDGIDVECLIKNADTAMYQAKEVGNGFRFYATSMSTVVGNRMNLEMDLRRALERQELVLYYQPKINIKTGRVVGTEALVRWIHPQRGIIYPDQFIPIAEENGLVIQIGEWVLMEATKQHKQWKDANVTSVPISVNISPIQFQVGNIVETVSNILNETQTSPQAIELEITEGIAMFNENQAIQRLNELREFGLKLAIDDFGTGYSSLSYLMKFPVHSIKIDKSFINETISSWENQAQIIKSIIDMAHGLNLKVVGEGVDTIEKMNFLRECGCDELQGYLFSRPLSPHDFANFIQGS